MKQNNKIMYLIPILLLSFVLISWNSTKEIKKPSVNEYLSGENIFREIIFFEGADLKKEVSEFSRFSSLAKQRGEKENMPLSEFKEFTIKLIKDKNPNYFNEFRSIIVSNNPLEIQSLLSSSFSLVSISQAIYTSEKKEKADYLEIFKASKNILDLKSTKETLHMIDDMYQNLHGKNNAAKAGEGLITYPMMPGIVYTFIPPCSIVAVCAIVTVMDAQASLDRSSLLTERVVSAIINIY